MKAEDYKLQKQRISSADTDFTAAFTFLMLSVKNLQIYNEERRRFSLVKNQPRRIVEKVASDIEKLLAKKRKALDVSL